MNQQANISEPPQPVVYTDEQYIQRVQSGETEAFENLVQRHHKTVFNLVYRMIGDYDEASEVAQEVFLSAFKSIKQFRQDAKFSTWLYRIALNHGSTHRKNLANRRQRVVSLLGSDPGDSGHRDPALSVARKELQFHIQTAMDSLAADHASVVLLIDVQGFSYEEAAETLKIRIETVKTRLHRARQALKTKLLPILRERGMQ